MMLAVVVERLDGVFAGSFESRVDTKENADCHGSEESDGDDFPADVRREWGNSRNEKGENIAE